MAIIVWDTNGNHPCCPGRILSEDGRSVLIQTDFDFPGVAVTFGWSLKAVQRCQCGATADGPKTPTSDMSHCQRCGHAWSDPQITCDHRGTDGTIDCPDCDVHAAEFIRVAGKYLADNDGATAEDPGYFTEE